jgi:hypothetical protein
MAMKKILLALAVIFTTTSANANTCIEGYKSYAPTDTMIKTADYYDDGTLAIWVNNIRNFKAIDIEFYGFTPLMAERTAIKWGCKKVVFKNAYNDSGIPQF